MSDSKRRDKEVAIFDLDGTIIDSSHRTPNNLDGTLNLERYHEMFNRSNVRKSHHGRLPDPQYKTKQLKKYKSTAYEFYDDALPIIDLFETYPNVTMVNANTANGVYQDGS